MALPKKRDICTTKERRTIAKDGDLSMEKDSVSCVRVCLAWDLTLFIIDAMPWGKSSSSSSSLSFTCSVSGMKIKVLTPIGTNAMALRRGTQAETTSIRADETSGPKRFPMKLASASKKKADALVRGEVN